MQKLINFVKGEIIAGAAILSIFGDKPSGPHDFLTFKPIRRSATYRQAYRLKGERKVE